MDYLWTLVATHMPREYTNELAPRWEGGDVSSLNFLAVVLDVLDGPEATLILWLRVRYFS